MAIAYEEEVKVTDYRIGSGRLQAQRQRTRCRQLARGNISGSTSSGRLALCLNYRTGVSCLFAVAAGSVSSSNDADRSAIWPDGWTRITRTILSGSKCFQTCVVLCHHWARLERNCRGSFCQLSLVLEKSQRRILLSRSASASLIIPVALNPLSCHLNYFWIVDPAVESIRCRSLR